MKSKHPDPYPRFLDRFGELVKSTHEWTNLMQRARLQIPFETWFRYCLLIALANLSGEDLRRQLTRL